MNNRILFLHGWGADNTRYSKLQKLLNQKGFETIALDLPGFGQTEAPTTAWGIDDYAEWVFKELDKVEWGRVILVGHSFGGQIAAKMAYLKPDRIEKLILIGPALFRDSRSLKLWILRTITEIFNFIFSLPLLKNFYDFARWSWYHLLRQYDYYRSNGVMRETLKKVIAEDLTYVLPQIATPTLLLWGDRDTFTKFKNSERAISLMRNVKFVPYFGHGHNFHYYLEDRVVGDILEFINTFQNQKQ